MANSPQARKRARQAEKHRQHNMMLRSRVRTYMKRVMKAIESGNQELALQEFKEAQPFMDGSVNKGIFHRNKIARHKSRLYAKIRAMDGGETVVENTPVITESPADDAAPAA